MTSPLQSRDTNTLGNATPILKSSLGTSESSLNYAIGRSAPILPPRPMSLCPPSTSPYSYNMPFSGYSGMGMGLGGGYGSYNSFGMPYQSSLYNSYNSYNSGMYGYNGLSNVNDDAERRFIQYAEESSRKTFANVENIVRAFNSIAMMLDNTFFAMTSSFRAVLSVAENFGRLRSMFGHIWYTVNLFRLFSWFYKKVLQLFGLKVHQSSASYVWKRAAEAASTTIPPTDAAGSSWPTFAFLGVLISAPYIINKFLPKIQVEDKSQPQTWKSPGVGARAAFDYNATNSSEMSMKVNDDIILAPTYIQESLNLKSTGWGFAVCNGRSGVVPLNYLVINKSRPLEDVSKTPTPIPKTHKKSVSFGENQIFEHKDAYKNENVIGVKKEQEPLATGAKKDKEVEPSIVVDTKKENDSCSQ